MPGPRSWSTAYSRRPTSSPISEGGFRVWGFEANLELNPGLLPGVSQKQRGGWGDPLLAGRYRYEFGNRFGETAYGDLGGFGVGAHTDWQLIGTIDYTLSSWIDLHLGYRRVNFNYTTEVRQRRLQRPYARTDVVPRPLIS